MGRLTLALFDLTVAHDPEPQEIFGSGLAFLKEYPNFVGRCVGAKLRVRSCS
jgi:hypothetical protein